MFENCLWRHSPDDRNNNYRVTILRALDGGGEGGGGYKTVEKPFPPLIGLVSTYRTSALMAYFIMLHLLFPVNYPRQMVSKVLNDLFN